MRKTQDWSLAQCGYTAMGYSTEKSQNTGDTGR